MITFNVSGTIIVSNELTVSYGGSLIVSGGDTITISGNEVTRVWRVIGVLMLRNLRVINGYSDQGSGLYNTGEVDISNCTFSGNHSTGHAGGIANGWEMSINNSTIFGNSAVYGGGIVNYNNIVGLSINNSTISGNSAIEGGGLVNQGQFLSIKNSTFSNNSAPGGGGGILSSFGADTVNIANSIVANSPSGDNCKGPIWDLGHKYQMIIPVVLVVGIQCLVNCKIMAVQLGRMRFLRVAPQSIQGMMNIAHQLINVVFLALRMGIVMVLHYAI